MTDLSQELEQLVVEGRSASQPTPADFERVLGRIRGQLGTGAGTSAASAGHHGVRWLSAKTIGIAAAGVVLMSGIALWTPTRVTAPARVESSTQRQPAPSAVPDLRVIPSSAGEVRALAQSNQPAATSANPIQSKGLAPNPSVREPVRSRDSLSDEVAILSRAETELHNGRADTALRSLGEHERRFPNGILTEERIAAKVQALCALGRNAEANAQLTRLRPGSLHNEAARRACAASSGVRQTSATGQPSPSGATNKH